MPGDHQTPLDIQERGRKGGGSGRTGGGGYPSGAQRPAPPPNIATAPLSRTIPPPHWVRPPQALEIQVDASNTGFNNGNTPAVIPGSAFQVPTNRVGVIRSFAMSVNAMVGASRLQWDLLFDGRPVQGWNGLTIFPRPAASVTVAYGPDETYIMVPDGTEISVRITVDPADGLTYQAGVSYHGWHYGKGLQDVFDAVYTP